RLPPEPDLNSQPADVSIAVDVSDRVFEILDASKTREVVPLGSAFPSPLLFPLARLGQSLAASAKSLDPWSTVADLTPGNAEL
ncbi:GntR family transcriptional regulator, partial [Enterococcus faecium]